MTHNFDDLKQRKGPVWAVAHRGFRAKYPENTMLAFEKACQFPIHAIETDIQMSKDEKRVIYHDRTLHSVGGGLRRVRTQAWQQLGNLNIGTQTKPLTMPQLADILDKFGQQTLWLLEIKRREPSKQRFQRLMDLVIEDIRRFNLCDRVNILCFDFDLLAYGYEKAPELRYVWNQDRFKSVPQDHFLFAYSLNINAVTKDIVSQIHQREKLAYSFTVNTEKQLNKALNAGIDLVMSDDPQWLCAQLEVTQ